jgi:ADP-ribose pyrophosphatase
VEYSVAFKAMLNPIPSHAKKVFSGQIYDLYQWEQLMFDGSTHIFEKLKQPDAVTIICVTTDNKILITNEEQPNIGTFVGLPGGRIEQGEDPYSSAARELSEETGYTSDDIEIWQSVQPATKIDYTIHYFIAKNCKLTTTQNLDAGEKILVDMLDFDDFMKLITSAQFRDKRLAWQILSMERKGELEEFKKLLFG